MTDVRLIDANALKIQAVEVEIVTQPYTHYCSGLVVFNYDIDEAPTIDAVPVVRCRNCRYWRRTEEHYGKCPFLIVEHQYTSEDGFCNLGEKMDGGAEP